MDKNEAHIRLVQILADELRVDVKAIKGESLLREELGADSLDTAEIALMIKERFEYDLTEDEMKKIKTVNDIVECITKNVAN